MPQVLRTSQAELDLRAAWYYVAAGGDAAADWFHLRFDRLSRKIAQTPYMFRARAELGNNLRSVPCGMLVVFYRPPESGIEVIRVLHGALDIDKIFGAD